MGFFMLGAIAAAMAAALYSMSGTTRFVPDACRNAATYLPAHVVGQDLALRQLIDAVCEHLAEDPVAAPGGGGGGGAARPAAAAIKPRKPLLISAHGPPGVGKTFTHTLLARALYNVKPAEAKECPGAGCQGAKVLYGMSYLESDRSGQLSAVRDAVLSHLRSSPNPLLVVEEYDKLDCESRAMLRQLVTHPELANTSMSRAIVMLESNLGFLELEDMLTRAGGDKSKITPEAADSKLRQVVTEALRRRPQQCESFEDTLAFAAAIDFYLPFFPLTRQEVTTLMRQELLHHYGPRLAPLGAELVAAPGAVAWLVDRVHFGDSYPMEGAKQVSTVCVKHVSRLVRVLQDELRQEAAAAAAAAAAAQPKAAAAAPVVPAVAPLRYQLEVAPSGSELRLRRLDPD